MAQEVVIKDLILAAAQGVSAGITSLSSAQPPIEAVLEEFEIEVSYACTTEFNASVSAEVQMKFWVVKAKFSAQTSYKRTTTYGLKVRFLFTGKSEEETSAT